MAPGAAPALLLAHPVDVLDNSHIVFERTGTGPAWCRTGRPLLGTPDGPTFARRGSLPGIDTKRAEAIPDGPTLGRFGHLLPRDCFRPAGLVNLQEPTRHGRARPSHLARLIWSVVRDVTS